MNILAEQAGWTTFQVKKYSIIALFNKVLTASYAFIPGIYNQCFQNRFVSRMCVSSEKITFSSISYNFHSGPFIFPVKCTFWLLVPSSKYSA